jgi:hypothetical protein
MLEINQLFPWFLEESALKERTFENVMGLCLAANVALIRDKTSWCIT